MKDQYIVAYCSGGQPSSVMMIRITRKDVAAVVAARESLKAFREVHGGQPALKHLHAFNVWLFEEIVDGFIPGIEDYSCLIGNPQMLPDGVDCAHFLRAQTNMEFDRASETEGLLIYEDRIHILSSEKHSDIALESSDISDVFDQIAKKYG